MTNNNERNNYVDGMFLDVNDFQTEQDYFIEKIRNITNSLATNGALDISSLAVTPDTVMAQPVSPAQVAVAISAAPTGSTTNPQNFTIIPDVLGSGLQSFQLYTVFQARTYNVQRVDLRITLNQALTNENLTLTIKIRQLVDGTNPLSPPANNPPLAQIQLQQANIPALNSDNFLQLDFSNENSGQGISVTNQLYYAIEVQYTRPLNSTSSLRIFHSPLNQLSQFDSTLFTFVFSGNAYTQSFTNTLGIKEQFLLYYTVYTSAVQISAGTAVINGLQTIVTTDQFRLLEVPDRRNVDSNGLTIYNYVVLTFTEQYTNPQLLSGSKNSADTRILDTSSASVLTQPQWDQLVADTTQVNKYLLLAVVNDSNIVSIFKENTFTVPANSTNLAFHDWLNPSNLVPIEDALILQQTRPSDFIFFVSNVPAQVPLTDAFGNVQLEPATVLDQFGNVIVSAGDPILVDIVRVVVNITLDNGANTRNLELSTISQIGTTTVFKNYGATVSQLFDNPYDNVFTYNYNTDQLAPNVVYNFVAYTTSGQPIYIQDYNKTISQPTSTGGATSLRDQTFTTFLNQGALTIVLNQDLQLGSFNPASDQAQPGVTQYVPTLLTGETPIPVGSAQINHVTFNHLIQLDAYQSFLFPVPMVRADGITKVTNTDTAVQAAYNAGDVTVLVDLADGAGPIDITFSGPYNRDRGGNGSAVLITGAIDSSVPLPVITTALVKVRNASGKDNTNLSTLFSPYGPAKVGGATNILAFDVLARGYDPLVTPTNVAGFNDGDAVYIWINDQQALDQNYQPITFIYNSMQTTITLPTIYHLGSQKYFREKLVDSIQSSTLATPGFILIDTGLDASGNVKNSGQVIFNSAEIPTSINLNATITLKYNSVVVIPQNIDYYQARYPSHGTKSGYPISNVNTVTSSSDFISVPEAFALTASLTNSTALDPATFQSVALFVDGVNVTSLLSPIGQKQIVADNGVTLQPGQIAYNPLLGTFKFYKYVETYDAYGTIISEAPSDYTRLSIAYFKLETQFIFNSSSTASYDPKFDINNDGRIDELDLNVFNSAYGSIIGEPKYLAAADFNSDGKVDSTDLALFSEHFGSVALGTPDYSDATSARLQALLVVQANNYLKKLSIIRAVSRAPDAIAPNGRTVLFLSDTTPVAESANYNVTFGFAAAMSLGFIQAEVETILPLTGLFNFNNINMFETVNPTNTRTITQVQPSLIPTATNTYTSLLTFTPAVNITSTYTISSLWNANGLAIKNTKDLVIPQKYEQLDRKVYGPFKLQYDNTQFTTDGTSIAFSLKATDATLTNGSPDPTGKHIQGVPLDSFTFAAHLTVPNTDGTQTLWSWYNLVSMNGVITLQFDPTTLFIDHQVQGKNGVEVLTPFGLGVDQVSLMPYFAGGDLQNDLSNISIVRNDNVSKYVIPHAHTNIRDGGLLTSRSIQFADDLLRLNIDGDVTDAVYALLDLINEQNTQIQLLRALAGTTRYDSGLFWDDPKVFWDSN